VKSDIGQPVGSGRGTMVFDLDGTLADTSADLLASANTCFRAMGAGDLLTPADSAIAFHGGRVMLREGLTRMGHDPGDIAAHVDLWYPRLLAAYEDRLCVETRLYPGAEAALRRLRAEGLATAICTNKPERPARALIAALGVGDLFDAIVGADRLSVRKPDPAPYRLAVSEAGGGAGPSVLIGDTETDLRTARAAGVPVLLVAFGPEGEAIGRLGPDALLRHFDDLADLSLRLLPHPV
jgi:phosphoglycolate phosphatase